MLFWCNQKDLRYLHILKINKLGLLFLYNRKIRLCTCNWVSCGYLFLCLRKVFTFFGCIPLFLMHRTFEGFYHGRFWRLKRIHLFPGLFFNHLGQDSILFLLMSRMGVATYNYFMDFFFNIYYELIEMKCNLINYMLKR